MNKVFKNNKKMITVGIGAIMIFMIAIILISCIKKHNKGIVLADIVSNWECTVDGKDISDTVRMADYAMYEMKTAYRLGHREEYANDDRIFS